MSVVNTLALIGRSPHPYKISSLGQYTSIHSLKVLRRGHHCNVVFEKEMVLQALILRLIQSKDTRISLEIWEF